jgi:hypothetical protein
MGDRQVASILTSLVSPIARIDFGKHRWMPRGFCDPDEAKLGECDLFLTPELREELTSWWLVNRGGANTPNWDLVSTCTVDGREGLLLVEAKAHDTESRAEGKLPGDPTNHEQIGRAIQEANAGLNSICPGWSITRDSHYQLSNRLAWAWKVASLGVPVILVYLGFLHAEEMRRCGTPFSSAGEWQSFILNHAKRLVPQNVWDTRLQTRDAPIWAMIRSLDLRWIASGVPEEVTA